MNRNLLAKPFAHRSHRRSDKGVQAREVKWQCCSDEATGERGSPVVQDALSLVDVLTPPDNQWLKKLSWSKANLPAGIRVVRFSDAGDDESDPPDLVAVAITLGAPPGMQSRSRKAAGRAIR